MLNFGNSRLTELVQAWASENDYSHPPESCPRDPHEHLVVKWEMLDGDHDWGLVFQRVGTDPEWALDRGSSLHLMAQQSADRIGRQLSQLAGERIQPEVHAHFAEPPTNESEITTGQYL
jgi:hypothetical protein